jgi:hypothetical protein
VVVAGGVVGEGAHAVPNVVEPLRPCHCHHVTQHGRQVVPIKAGFPFFLWELIRASDFFKIKWKNSFFSDHIHSSPIVSSGLLYLTVSHIGSITVSVTLTVYLFIANSSTMHQSIVSVYISLIHLSCDIFT